MEGQNGRKRWRSRGQEKGGRADEHRERGDVRKGTEDRKLGHSHTKTRLLCTGLHYQRSSRRESGRFSSNLGRVRAAS